MTGQEVPFLPFWGRSNEKQPNEDKEREEIYYKMVKERKIITRELQLIIQMRERGRL